jgi:predicted GIY-YIG superfamily endonuclease
MECSISLDKVSMSKHYYVYIMTNKGNTVLYTGITSDLKKRVFQHKEKLLRKCYLQRKTDKGWVEAKKN